IIGSSVAAGILLFFWAAYLTWNAEHTKLEQEEKKRGRPEITASFSSFIETENGVPSYMLALYNSSHFPAVDVHIEDIRYKDKVLRFQAPDAIVYSPSKTLVECGILCNGWTPTNDIMSLFEGEDLRLIPNCKLKIIFSSPDSVNRKNWVFSALFWYDV